MIDTNKCPKCGCDLIDHETVNDYYDIDDTNAYEITATCCNCKTKYRWIEIYEMTRIEDFEEVEKEND